MQTILLYLLKVIACSAIFAGYYWCFLRNGSFHKWNRFYLLFSIIGSVIIPLINIPVYIINEIPQPVLYESSGVDGLPGVKTIQAQSGINYLHIVTTIYSLIVFAFLIIEFKNILIISRLKNKAKKSTINNIKIYSTDSEAAPFSFFNSVFWKSDIDISSDDGQRILQHELAHIKAKHSYDKLFMQVMCTVFWMNPIFWLLKRELSLVHEYEADKACIADNDTEKLSALILCSVYPNYYLEFTSQFFQSPIKRRLTMLAQNKKIRFTLLRQIMLVPVAIITILAFALHIEAKPVFIPDDIPEPFPMPQPFADTIQTQKKSATTYKYDKDSKEVVPYAVTPVKPKFQGGSAHNFPKWAQNQTIYPTEAINKKISGTVYIQFIIDVDGSLTDYKILRSVDPLLDSEALRAVKLSPKWTPGKDKNGNIVPVSYQLPIIFQLQKTNTNNSTRKQTTTNNTNTNKSDAVPYALVSVKPKFQDNDANKFPAWVQSQAVYPEEAKKKKISGVVYVQFVVDIDGGINNIKVLRSVDPLLDNETVRAVKLSPKWTPGKDNNGNAVAVSYQFPVVYRIPESDDNEKDKGTPAKINSTEIIPYAVAAIQPKFEGGKASNFSAWVQNNLKYPEEAVKQQVSGSVYIEFVINVDGNITEVKVIRGVDSLLNNEAIRIIKSSPKWTPGKNNKLEIVPVKYIQEVIFKL